jgi:hypothetical protein
MEVNTLNDEPRSPRRPPEPADPDNGRTPSDEEERPTDPAVPFDAPEADVLEQARPWGDEGVDDRPKIPDDAPEADVLEQSQSIDYDDRDRRDD